ncbi:MAG TPA: carboxypeptidase-like regulatory domain-containing protein, partial [Puia sp.]|nr:carboxypeptidase-like regulatory domain-containing protein [Puia sp.]
MCKRSFVVWVIFILSVQRGLGQTGEIRGNVYDQVTRDGLSGASISLEHTAFKRAADAKGNFSLLQIPAGEYELIVTSVGYLEVRRHIRVKRGEVQKIFIALSQATGA